ncbi:hypothetical protein Emed_007267 [Eimeria media]
MAARRFFRRIDPPRPGGGGVAPVGAGEGVYFAGPGLSRLGVFAVLGGIGRRMLPNEPCWLVRCTLRDVYREMVFNRAMREIYPDHDLRRFVELPPSLSRHDMDPEYSYAVAPSGVESVAAVTEDYERRWHAFRPDNDEYPFQGAFGDYPARGNYRGPRLRLWVVRRSREARLFFGPRHPVGPNGGYVNFYPLHTRYPTGVAPPFDPLPLDASSTDASSDDFPLPPLRRPRERSPEGAPPSRLAARTGVAVGAPRARRRRVRRAAVRDEAGGIPASADSHTSQQSTDVPSPAQS